ncbi:hypothetical protein MRB53_037397 [Persea americana]|nr:hypothetical protein MRB53_037397 [Persea americana]
MACARGPALDQALTALSGSCARRDDGATFKPRIWQSCHGKSRRPMCMASQGLSWTARVLAAPGLNGCCATQELVPGPSSYVAMIRWHASSMFCSAVSVEITPNRGGCHESKLRGTATGCGQRKLSCCIASVSLGASPLTICAKTRRAYSETLARRKSTLVRAGTLQLTSSSPPASPCPQPRISPLHQAFGRHDIPCRRAASIFLPTFQSSASLEEGAGPPTSRLARLLTPPRAAFSSNATASTSQQLCMCMSSLTSDKRVHVCWSTHSSTNSSPLIVDNHTSAISIFSAGSFGHFRPCGPKQMLD